MSATLGLNRRTIAESGIGRSRIAAPWSRLSEPEAKASAQTAASQAAQLRSGDRKAKADADTKADANNSGASADANANTNVKDFGRN
jgi:hypothetical protein